MKRLILIYCLNLLLGLCGSINAEGLRIGLFFGSFDPVHQGHEVVIRQSIKSLSLDKLYVIPYVYPDTTEGESFSARCKLVRKAFEDVEQLFLFKEKIIRKIAGKSHMRGDHNDSFEAKVLEYIRYEEGWDNSFFHLVGTDEFLDMVKRNRFPDRSENRRIVVVKRPGYNQTIPRKYLPELGRRLFVMDFKTPSVSSSRVRAQLHEGVRCHQVSTGVMNLIATEHLYNFSAKPGYLQK